MFFTSPVSFMEDSAQYLLYMYTPCTFLRIMATGSLYSADRIASVTTMESICFLPWIFTAGNVSSPGEHCICDLSTLRILSPHFPQGLRVAVWPRHCYTMMRDTSLEQMLLAPLYLWKPQWMESSNSVPCIVYNMRGCVWPP